MLKNAVLSLFLTLSFFCTTYAEAKIDILPRMVVVDSRDKSGELTILNMSDQATAYRIELLSMRQNTEGVYTELDTPLSPFFDPSQHVRFSPRQFTLPPNGRQKIRVSVRRPKDLPEGDYRFHVRASEVPVAKENKHDYTTQDEEIEGQQLSIAVNIAVAIPVVVRSGKNDLSGEMKNFTLLSEKDTENGRPQLHFETHREGNISLLGRFSLYWTPEGGKKERIGYISNLNIFSEVDYRKTKLNLSAMPSGNGKLIAELKDIVTGNILHEATLK